MKCRFEDGLYSIRVPGAIIYSENKDLLWEGYMTWMICRRNKPDESKRDIVNVFVKDDTDEYIEEITRAGAQKNNGENKEVLVAGQFGERA